MYKNVGVSVLMFIILFFLLWLVQSYTSLVLLKWHDAAWCVGIPASIIGVAYVLTIRDPNNYTGFYPGILMSVLLSVQFFLQSNYDLTALYIFVFVPFQARSIIVWKKAQTTNFTFTESFTPQFLPFKTMLVTFIFFLVIIAADWLLVTFINHQSFDLEGLTTGWLLKLLGAFMIASSIMANFWLIYRKNDAWIYWIIYSLAGIGFYVVLGNIFSIVLFSFFLVINSLAAKAWIRP